jgi:hypothetical protein
MCTPHYFAPKPGNRKPGPPDVRPFPYTLNDPPSNPQPPKSWASVVTAPAPPDGAETLSQEGKGGPLPTPRRDSTKVYHTCVPRIHALCEHPFPNLKHFYCPHYDLDVDVEGLAFGYGHLFDPDFRPPCFTGDTAPEL